MYHFNYFVIHGVFLQIYVNMLLIRHYLVRSCFTLRQITLQVAWWFIQAWGHRTWMHMQGILVFPTDEVLWFKILHNWRLVSWNL
jgi:hypothetical protein